MRMVPRETSLSHPVIFLLTIPRRYFFCGSFLFCVCLCHTVLSVSCSLVVTRPLGSHVCDVFLCICHFPIRNGVLGQVWYLIVSIPDLCLLSYFVQNDFPPKKTIQSYEQDK